MEDTYILRQKAIIKKEINKYLPGYLTMLFLLLLLIAVTLYAMDPPPRFWKSDEIIFVDAQYRSRMRSLDRYSSPGYELTDDEGNLYWAGSQLTWQELGQPYTIRYFMRQPYRKLAAVTDEGITILSEADSVAVWTSNTRGLGTLLVVWLLGLIWMSRSLVRVFRRPDVEACRKRIRAREASLNRRTRER